MSILADLAAPPVATRRPLADGRRRALFLQTRDPEDTALNVAVAYRLDGPLDTERLRAALARVAAEHEILRTTYGFDAEGAAFEMVRDELSPTWQAHDVAELPEAGRARRVEVLARRALGRPFDLAAEAPLRVTLIRTRPAESVLVLVAHAIAWDEETAGVFGAELARAYARPDATLTVRSYAAAVAAHPDRDGAIEFAGRADDRVEVRGRRIELGEAQAALPGPVTDLPRRPGAGTATHTARFTVAPALRDRLRTLAEAAGAAEFLLYQSAVAVLLRQHGAGAEVALGVTVAGRTDPLPAGPAATTLVLRTELGGDPTPRAVLDRSRTTALARCGHRDAPPEYLPGETCTATMDFREQDRPGATPVPQEIGFAFHGAPDGGLAAAVTVRAALFHAASAGQFADRLHRLLEAFADTPDLPIGRLAPGTAGERERVLHEWSAGVELPSGPDAAGLLGRGRMFPGARTALLCAGASLDYQELFARIGAVREAGTPDIPATGVGAAELVRLLVAFDAAARRGAPVTLAAGCAGGERVVIDPAAVAAAVADRRAVVTDCAPGSTDRARGSADVRLVVAPAPTVAVLTELLAGLVDGATVAVAAPDAAAAFLDSHRVTHVVASAGAVLGADGVLRNGPNRWSEVRRWDLWGDGGPDENPCARIAFAESAEFPARVAGTVGYAPAVAAGVVARGPVDGSGRVRPIPGSRVLVLDEAGNPCPPGVPGTVYVAGAALGRSGAGHGRFEDDPFAPGERRYRTADRAHWTVDGWLRFA